MAFTNFRFGDVVAASGNAQAHAGEMMFGGIQPAVPHQHIVGGGDGAQSGGNGIAAERGFEGVVAALHNSAVQSEAHTPLAR